MGDDDDDRSCILYIRSNGQDVAERAGHRTAQSSAALCCVCGL